MVNEVHIAYYQLILFVLLLFGFLYSGNLLILLFSLVALFGFLIFTIKIKKYNPILNHLVAVPILVLQGLILVYIYLFRFKSIQNQSYMLLFYAFVVIWIMITTFYIYYYSKKLYNKKIIENRK